MARITIGSLTADPGQTVQGYIPVGEYADGSPVRLPLFIVNGAAPGPVLFVGAGMHAPEITGVEVIRRLVTEVLDPNQLNGAIVSCPVLNPWGFHQVEMLTPQDGVNLNRTFPGDPNGTTSYRLAHVIYSQIVAHCDYVIDFHANPEPALQFSIVPDVNDENVRQAALGMAKAYGITCTQGASPGYLTVVAAGVGKPGIVVELVSWRRIVPEAVDSALVGVQNVLKHLGMMHGGTVPQTIACVPGDRPRSRLTVTAGRGGIVHPVKDPGDAVRANETIALIRNVFGEVVEQVVSPVDGWILAWPWILNQTVSTGDIVAFLAYDAPADLGGT